MVLVFYVILHFFYFKQCLSKMAPAFISQKNRIQSNEEGREYKA